MLSQSGYIILKSLTHPQSIEHYTVEDVACVYVPNREPFLLQALYRGSPLFFIPSQLQGSCYQSRNKRNQSL